MPWESGDLAAAVERGRDDEFYNFYLQSDLQDDLVPGVEDMGFRRSPELFEITEVRWDGGFDSVGSSASPDGVVLTEYDIDQVVDFRADFPEGTELEEGWEVLEPDTFHRVHVRGETRFVVRLAVLFGNDFGFSVEQLSWRRRDGRGPGVSLTRPDPNQLSLL